MKITKLAVLTAVILFSFTFNSCKNCNEDKIRAEEEKKQQETARDSGSREEMARDSGGDGKETNSQSNGG